MSSHAQFREQFGTRLHCAKCGTNGYATWEAHEGDVGTLGTVIRITQGFFVRGTDTRGNLEIACLKCDP